METYRSKVCSCGEDIDAALDAALKAVRCDAQTLTEEQKAQVRENIGVSEKPTIASIAVTESADGSVTMVNTLKSGGTETLVISADANGNPSKLTYNGTEIPITWNEVT